MNKILKQERKIAIRCLTRREKGYGNIKRCLTIADSLKKKKYKIIFIVDQNKEVIKELTKKKYNFYLIPKNSKTISDAKKTVKLLEKHKISTLIIDMREYGEYLSKFFFDYKYKIIQIDDIWSENVYADILINATNIKKSFDYNKINPNSKLFLGNKYWIANSEFVKNRKKISDIKPKKTYKIKLG